MLQVPGACAGLVVMELLIPLYWVSNSLVDGHHSQVSPLRMPE